MQNLVIIIFYQITEPKFGFKKEEDEEDEEAEEDKMKSRDLLNTCTVNTVRLWIWLFYKKLGHIHMFSHFKTILPLKVREEQFTIVNFCPKIEQI